MQREAELRAGFVNEAAADAAQIGSAKRDVRGDAARRKTCVATLAGAVEKLRRQDDVLAARIAPADDPTAVTQMIQRTPSERSAQILAR